MKLLSLIKYLYPFTEKKYILPSYISPHINDFENTESRQLLLIACKSIESVKEYFDYIEDYTSKGSDTVYLKRYIGEHYPLIYSLIRHLNIENVVEIGTFNGMASRIILDSRKDINLTTFDLIPWDKFQTHLSHDDFRSGKFTQVLANLEISEEFNTHLKTLTSAELIFLDGPKNISFEDNFLTLMSKSYFPEKTRYLLMDDIRFAKMHKVWCKIKSPKCDLTSLGHWSGTGLVDISKGLIFE